MLSAVADSRDNNFNLLRLLAASAVLYSHSFALSTGDTKSEPLRAAYGLTFGSIAVDVFFIISGMLVTMSLERRASAMGFVRARFLRIWPALTVVLLLSVFALGLKFTTVSAATYLTSKETARYLVLNLTLFKGAAYTLPGVFDGNPWPQAVNGSIWTLPTEVRCYACLLLAWLALRWGWRRPVSVAWIAALAWAGLFAWHVQASVQHTSIETSPARLWLMFATGAALYGFRARVPLDWSLLATALVILVGGAGHSPAYAIAYVVALPAAVLGLAHLPQGRVLRFNQLGDYSYGVYIYAYPVQQTLLHVHLFGIAELFCTSMAVTLMCAVFSWHFIEKPALAMVRSKTVAPAAKRGAFAGA